MMKKILFVQNTLSGGGAEKVLIDILRNFDYLKYEVTLVLIWGQGVYMDNIPKNVHVKILFNMRIYRIAFWLRKLKLYRLNHLYRKIIFRNLIRGEKFDTIISFLEWEAPIFHSYVFGKAYRNISWVHTDLSKNNEAICLFDSFEHQRSVYERMNDVVFVSQGVKDAFNRVFGADRSTVIYNLIDSIDIRRKSQEFNVERKKFTICNVGRIVSVKRQDRIIEVSAILKEKGYDFEVWILGIGTLENKLREQVNENGLEGIVSFKGFQENPYPFMAAADVFLLTSDAEGYPLVVCEALCLGKAIVSTNIAGPNEILSDGSGLLVEPDVEKIATVVEDLYHHPEEVRRLGDLAYEKSKMFNVKNTMNAIYQVL